MFCDVPWLGWLTVNTIRWCHPSKLGVCKLVDRPMELLYEVCDVCVCFNPNISGFSRWDSPGSMLSSNLDMIRYLLSPEDWGLTVTWWPGLAWSPHCPTETERDGRWRLSSLSSLTVRLGATTRGRWTSGCFFSTSSAPHHNWGNMGVGSAIKFHWVDTVSTISFRGVRGKYKLLFHYM